MNRLKWDGPCSCSVKAECGLVDEDTGEVVLNGLVTHTIIFNDTFRPETPDVLAVESSFIYEYDKDVLTNMRHLRTDVELGLEDAVRMVEEAWWNEHAANLFTWHEPTHTEPGYWT